MAKYMKNFTLIIVLILSMMVLTSCKEDEVKYTRYTFNLDDAFFTNNIVNVFTLEKLTEEQQQELFDELNIILFDLDNIFNVQQREPNTTSDLIKVNQNSGISPVVVDEQVIFVLKEAILLSEKSIINETALFDPTIAPVWDLWDFVDGLYNPMEDNRTTIPTQDKIDQALQLVDYTKIIIDEDANTIFLEDEGMKLDLGSIVKGYAADKIKDHLISKGYDKAVIDVGRNILTLGSHFTQELEDKPWTVTIQTPFVTFADKNYDDIKTYGTVYISNSTVVTSGVYEKYIMDEEGEKYHHILDPRSGYPIDNKVISVTVITQESIIGDAYSTALFSLGIEKGMELVRNTDNLEAIWIIENGADKEIYVSQGLEENFVFNENVMEKGYVYKGVYYENTEN